MAAPKRFRDSKFLTVPFGARTNLEPLRSVRAILQNALDSLHDIVRQLRQDLKRIEVLVELLDLRRPQDHRAHVGIQQAPCDGELGHRAIQIGGDRLQFAGLGDDGPALVVFEGRLPV